MRLSFDDEDEDAYFVTRDALLDEIVDSLSPVGRGAPDPEEVAGAISVLLDWRWNYSSGQLDDWVPRLAKMDARSRAALPGITPERTFQIVAGGIVLSEAMRAFGVKQLDVSPWALREGRLLQMLDRV